MINGKDWGVIYHNQVFQPLKFAQKIKGYILKVREDGKIDLTLTQMGHHGADEVGPRIVALLQAQGGFLKITDKTDPETITRLFGCSKKKFKIALGGLYKKRLIIIDPEGIRLVQK